MNKYIKLLKSKNYIYVYASQVISNFGDAFTMLAFPLFAYYLSGTILSSGIILMCETIPWIIIGPFAGILADKYDQKRILLISDLCRAILTFALFMTANIYVAYIMAFLMGIFTSCFTAARSSIIPNLLDKDLLESGVTLSSLSRNIISLLGPSIGTIMLAIFSSKFLFIIDSITYIISFILLLNLNINMKNVDKTRIKHYEHASIKTQIFNGFLLVKNNSIIKPILDLDIIKTLFEAIISVLIISLIKKYYKLDDSFYALIMTFNSIGILIGIFICSKFNINKYKYKLIFVSTIIIFLVIYMHSITLNKYIFLLLWFLYGFCLGIRELIMQVIFANNINDNERGRVYSFSNSMISLAYVIGYLSANYIYIVLGIKNSFAFCSIMLGVLSIGYILKNNFMREFS
ncbi:Predicted arabinose efflux permease, MFS family [Clostridium acidisoli DSM 12555]|uniref:Predicted arabinose efflux permease, MFS family n=2 Tax=Clostridium TaxID=1485 RepID=A0A1W1XNC4_9CLOT|nr:MFS transporter [Clostridium acidisoli]SMC25355.1 Predicted arabinose efflux permease, MFS family [Clostridium acidisoli DSM 12555]